MNLPATDSDSTVPEPQHAADTPSRVRFHVLGMLCLLSFILYLDRICIAQAVPFIEAALGISHSAMGLVLGAFTLAYGLFEVPSGHWGDRYGSRGVLTRIVIWWSVFTMLTGAATGLIMLLVVRFLFGAGEAGALPNAARVVARWFPAPSRGRAQGIVIASALVGGTLAPVVAQALMATFGWRLAFALLGIPGILWAVLFHRWFRDNPAEHPGTNEAECRLIGAVATAVEHVHPPIPWGLVLCSPNIWLLGTVATCGSFTTYLFFSWYPTYLQKGRGVDPDLSSILLSMVLAGGTLGSLLGGMLTDALLRRTGNRRWSRSSIGLAALTCAGLAMVASIGFSSAWLAASCAAAACFLVHLQLAAWWSVITEISGPHLGALFGLMNSLGVPGAIASQLFLGRFVDWLGARGFSGRAQWDPAFWVYGAVLLGGAACWLFIDANRSVTSNSATA